MGYGFRWNDWNLEHATRHGRPVEEIEAVVRREARARRVGDCGQEKLRVEGRGLGGRVIEVVFVIDDDEDRHFFVIHAMPLTTRRRRNRS